MNYTRVVTFYIVFVFITRRGIKVWVYNTCFFSRTASSWEFAVKVNNHSNYTTSAQLNKWATKIKSVFDNKTLFNQQNENFRNSCYSFSSLNVIVTLWQTLLYKSITWIGYHRSKNIIKCNVKYCILWCLRRRWEIGDVSLSFNLQ